MEKSTVRARCPSTVILTVTVTATEQVEFHGYKPEIIRHAYSFFARTE